MADELFYVVELLVIFYTLCVMYDDKIKWNLMTILFFLLDVIILAAINREMLPKFSSVVIYLGLILYGKLDYKVTWFEAAKKLIMTISLISAFQITFSGIVFGMFDNLLSETQMALIINLCILFFFIFIFRKIRKNEIFKFIVKQLKENKLVSGYLVIVVIFFVILFNYLGEVPILQVLFMAALFLLIVILFGKWKKEQWQKEIEIENLKQGTAYEESYKKMIQQMRRKQHDYDNHINAIYAMAMLGGKDEELAESVKSYYDADGSQKYSKMFNEESSPVIIGFLYMKFQEAEKLGIDIIPHIVIAKAECRIAQRELIEILGILLDNAVEAVQSRKPEEKKIKITMIEFAERIEILVENRSDYINQNQIEKFFVEGYSTKGEGRGIGLSNVKRIVNGSKGMLHVENKKEDGEQWFSIMAIVKK